MKSARLQPRKLLAAALACGLLAAAPAYAQFAKPEAAVKYRQSAFILMGTSFARLGAMVQGKAPFDAKVALDNAQIVEFMSHLPWQAFTPGTDLPDSHAKPAIWKEMDKFKADANKLQEMTPKLVAAAKTGKLDDIKVVFGETAKTCKSCHDSFREEL
ncbi:cytochrome c' [mine drainage metagenome]|jgi:cytochrome c556|uniref:Cytochrome c n=1 Tax=mine drainage metagenome TaxID=410659 RepID=A0A1J5Q8R7_9ZZZZ